MRFIGDVHGKYEQYNVIKNQSEKSFQVGDFGFGFVPVPDIFRATDRFILGNHDDPKLGRQHPNHLESGTEWEGIFPVNGAYSIDRYNRIEGRDWWPDEEHSHDQLNIIMDQWEVSNCDIVVAHDCPADIRSYIHSHHCNDISKTCQALSSLIYIRKPKLFIFGHHHKRFDEIIGGVRYICLPELGFIDI